MFTWMKSLAIVAAVALASLAPAAAKDVKPWKVDGKLLGEVDGGDVKKAKDVSGIACAPGASLPRLCLVVDDETQGAQIVLLNEDSLTAGDFIRLSTAQFDGKPLELDAESVAFEDGNFYVAGSHGRARHEPDDKKKEQKNIAKAEASRQIFRIVLPVDVVDMKTGQLRSKPAVSPPAKLTAILQSHPEIARSYDQALADNGLTIEGLAVRDKRLFVGLRGPVIGTDAVVVSVSAAAIFDGAPVDSKVHPLNLDTDKRGKARGIRDLVRHNDGFLVLAGPVNDPENGEIADGDYSIYRWDGASTLSPRADLESFGKKVKPEAMLPLSGDLHHVRLLLMFDGPKEGSPTPYDLKLD